MNKKNCYTVGVFEDNPIVTVGLSSYFQQMTHFSINLVFSTDNPKKFLLKEKKHMPDILIMDIISDKTFGLELFEQVFTQNSNAIVIAYTNVKSKQVIQSLLSLGVMGYIHKKDNLILFNEAFHSILINKKPYLPNYLTNVINNTVHCIVLSDTEKKIIPFLLNGYSSKNIAKEFFVTPSAIDFHKKNLYTKFNVNNIASLIKKLITQGYTPMV